MRVKYLQFVQVAMRTLGRIDNKHFLYPRLRAYLRTSDGKLHDMIRVLSAAAAAGSVTYRQNPPVGQRRSTKLPKCGAALVKS